MCGNWLHSGVFTEAGNIRAAPRRTPTRRASACIHNWAFSWPANRRVMYNRASADADGKPWDPTRAGITWNGEKWVGDVPDIKPDAPPGTFGAFIMLPGGRRRGSSPRALNDGPFPEHYEAIEAPGRQPRSTRRSTSNPASKKFASDKDVYGKKEDFPIVCTTYRLTEHFHYWTQHQHSGVLNELQPGLLRRDPGGARRKQKGIANGIAGQGDLGRAARSRAWRMVTKRLRADADRRQEHVADRVPDPLGLRGRPEPHRAARQLA